MLHSSRGVTAVEDLVDHRRGAALEKGEGGTQTLQAICENGWFPGDYDQC